MARNGNYDSTPVTVEIDKLNYTYDSYNQNRLIKVTDLTNSPLGFSDGANNANEYDYDGHGNMKRDDNKGITGILYNHLNLPTQITFSGTTTRKIQYLYNAVGTKQKKVVTDGTIITTTDYLSGFQYQNNVLEFFPHAEGYVKYTDRFFNYIFNYTDHLGNVRVSYGLNSKNVLKILEENHYYPFGLKHTNYNSETQNYAKTTTGGVELKAVVTSAPLEFKYKYNGKEFQDELGLNMYDYGARNYDPATGRWMNMDPLAEKSRRFSPYVYALNNPVFFVDPDGMFAKPSPLEAALISKHVYGDKVNLQGGWKVSTVGDVLPLDSDSGLKSAVYERTVDGKTEYTYATAGTEKSGKDYKNNISQLVGLSEQYKESKSNAIALKAKIGNAELSYTGHSLGGGLAEGNAIATGDYAVTFNAAGVSVFTKGLNNKSNTDAYIMTTDPLNGMQQASTGALPTAGGNKKWLQPRNFSGLLNGHSIDSVIDALNLPTAFQRLLQTFKQAITPPSFGPRY